MAALTRVPALPALPGLSLSLSLSLSEQARAWAVERREFGRRPQHSGVGISAGCSLGVSANARATRRVGVAHDQPAPTADGIAANIFDATLKELSGQTPSINSFPNGHLGQEAQPPQKLRAGDADVAITCTATAQTPAPQAAVCSRHFIFRGQLRLARALAMSFGLPFIVDRVCRARGSKTIVVGPSARRRLRSGVSRQRSLAVLGLHPVDTPASRPDSAQAVCPVHGTAWPAYPTPR